MATRLARLNAASAISPRIGRLYPTRRQGLRALTPPATRLRFIGEGDLFALPRHRPWLRDPLLLPPIRPSTHSHSRPERRRRRSTGECSSAGHPSPSTDCPRRRCGKRAGASCRFEAPASSNGGLTRRPAESCLDPGGGERVSGDDGELGRKPQDPRPSPAEGSFVPRSLPRETLRCPASLRNSEQTTSMGCPGCHGAPCLPGPRPSGPWNGSRGARVRELLLAVAS